MILLELLSQTIEKKASDLHLSSSHKPMIRIDGDLEVLLDNESIDEETIKNDFIKLNKQFTKHIENLNEFDLSISIPNIGRFRTHIFKQRHGLSITFRVIPDVVPTIEEFNFPPIIKELCNKNHGLILVTGPTGSGKSTTLAAMIDYINTNKKKHIITIEDPIEFLHTSKLSLVQQREVNNHTDSFQNAMRAILREDPDYIMVGEMRDIETIRLALTAAETGHLVLSTLHTSSATKTIDRIIDVFPAQEKDIIRTMFSESIRAIISQQLIKKPFGNGRMAIQEILIATPAVRNLIRENKIPQIYSLIQTGKEYGMQTAEQHLNVLRELK